jgi:metal-dependent amidase/aminoacylase/carboxypeptidase family protein
MMIHPYAGNFTLPETLALDALQVEFFGKPSHAAAAPWEGKNALDALILLFNSINTLRQQIRPDARINGIITHGGVAANIIPDYAVGRFYLRAKTRAYLSELVETFKACVQAATVATGTRAQVSNYEGSFDEMVNNTTLARRMVMYMDEALGAGTFTDKPDSFGSADMGDVSQVVPAIHVMIDIADGQSIHPHTREFCAAAASPFADQAVLRAGKGLALTGYDFLHTPQFRATVCTEFSNLLPTC